MEGVVQERQTGSRSWKLKISIHPRTMIYEERSDWDTAPYIRTEPFWLRAGMDS